MKGNFPERFGILVDEYPGSTSDLSKALDISKQTISAWRSGSRSPKGPTVETLARFFDVSVPWIMGLDVAREHYAQASTVISPEEKRLLAAWRKADTTYKSVALELLEAHPAAQSKEA